MGSAIGGLFTAIGINIALSVALVFTGVGAAVTFLINSLCWGLLLQGFS